MANRNFKLREQDYKAMLDMTEKQAGQFIKGLCGYAFDGVPMETKDAKIASAYAYAKTALDVSVKSRENGRKGGLLVAERMRGAKASPVKPSAAESDPMGMLLKGVVLSVAEDAAESKSKKVSEILCADAAAGLKTLPQKSVQMCVTSPPYYGLRDYGADGQIGVEQSPEEYVARLTEVFAEVHRVLKDDGTLWLNIADSYAGSGKGPMTLAVESNGKNKDLYDMKSRIYEVPKKWKGIKPKDMIGIPWMIAFALRDFGYYLRSDIIWHKTNCLPESVKDRPSKCYEHIFLLSKSPKYYFDYKAIREPIKDVTAERYKRGRSDNSKYYGKGNDLLQNINRPHDDYSMFDQQYRRKRDVWEVSTNTYKMDEHFAMFPEKLIEPCILAGSRAGDTVLDPFFGSGTTGAVAKRLGREYIGIEINPVFCKKAWLRIEKTETV